MKITTFSMLSFIFTLLFVACAPTYYISSDADPEFKFSKNDKIYIHFSDSSSLSNKKFYLLVKKEMQELGFNIVDDISIAERFLFISQDENSYDISYFLPLPTSTTTTGIIGNTQFKSTTSGTAFVPQTRTLIAKGIYFTLYDIDAYIKSGYKIPIWESYLGIEKYLFNRYPSHCIRKVLSVYGRNYSGTEYFK